MQDDEWVDDREDDDAPWENDTWEEEWPDEPDVPNQTVPCSSCGAEIFEFTEVCPHCGDFVSDTSDWTTGKSVWYVLLGGAGLIALLAALFGLMR